MSAFAAQSLFYIAIGAFVMPLVARRFNLPSVIGELIFGMALGYLGLIREGPFINFMAQIGFALLMFAAGMEIDFGPIRKGRSRLLPTAWRWMLLCFFFAAGGALLLQVGAWIALAVCAVSVGLASVIIKERGLGASPLGQAVLAAGLVGETVSILALTAFDFHHRLGFSAEFFLSLTKFTGIFILAYILMSLFRFLIWWYPQKVGRLLESGDPLELGVRLAVSILFVFVAAAAMLEVEAILGAFIAGALFGFIFQEREVIEKKINAMGQGFFVPFFFITVGSHFDPLASLPIITPTGLATLALIAVGSKLVPSLLFNSLGLSFRECVAGGLLLSAPLTLTIAIAEVAVRIDAISRETQGELIIVAIVMGLGAPYLARLLLPGSRSPAGAPQQRK